MHDKQILVLKYWCKCKLGIYNIVSHKWIGYPMDFLVQFPEKSVKKNKIIQNDESY